MLTAVCCLKMNCAFLTQKKHFKDGFPLGKLICKNTSMENTRSTIFLSPHYFKK